MNLNKRFMSFIETTGEKPTRFAKKIGISPGYMSDIKNEKKTPGIEVLNKLLSVYPNLNINWLLTGKGEMYNKPKDIEIMELKDKVLELEYATKTADNRAEKAEKKYTNLKEVFEIIKKRTGQKFSSLFGNSN